MLRARPALLLAVAIALAMAAGCAADRPATGGRGATAGELAELGALLAERRIVRPWLSGVDLHRPCKAPATPATATPSMLCAGAGKPDPRTLRRLGAAAARLERRLAEAPQARRLHADALLTVLASVDPRSVDRAVDSLQGALRDAPQDPDLLNDLAALLLVRAELRREAADLHGALRYANRGLATGAAPPASRFNRALALESLALWREAADTWRQLSRHGLPPGWAREIDSYRRRAEAADELVVAALARPDRRPLLEGTGDVLGAAVEADPFLARRTAEELLGRWGRLSRGGRGEAAEDSLRQARRIAERLAGVGGDRLLVDALGRIDDGDRGRLAEGHAALAAARGGGSYSDCAGAELAVAGEALAEAASPFVGWALLDRAVCAYFDKTFGAADGYLDCIDALARDRPYPILRARAAWIRGLLRMVQGRFSEAIDRFQESRRLFLAAGEAAHAAYLHSLLAETYRRVGADREAWAHRAEALRQRHRIRDPERVFTVFEEIHEALLAGSGASDALPFLSEQLRAASRAARDGEADLEIYTLLDRRQALLALGRVAPADADLERAEGRWAALPQGQESRRRLRVELDLERARAVGDSAARLAAIDRGLEFFRGGDRAPGDRTEALALHRAGARASLEASDPEAAERHLASGLHEALAQRDAITEAEYRAPYASGMRGLYEEMIALQLDRRDDPLRALDFVELAAASPMLASAPAGDDAGADPLRPREWRLLSAALPEGTRVVRIAQLGDHRLTWVLGPRGVRFEQAPLAARDLRDQLALLPRLLRQPDAGEELLELLGWLRRRLLPAWLGDLPAETHLVIVPDETTLGVPFAALVDARDGSFLIERHPISMAPSALGYLRSLAERAPPRDRRGEAVLVVADPAFDRRLFPTLPALAGAAEEGERVSGLYGEATLLGGAAATEAAVAAALPGHRTVHFAGHAVSDAQDGRRSGLLLAPADPARPDRRSSLLTAEELALLDLSGVRLVSLGACSTSIGHYPQSREVASLATAFLAAGASGVVASLWDVDDRAATGFFAELHRELAAGVEPTAALRRAQLSLLRDSQPGGQDPAQWAGFQLFHLNALRVLVMSGESVQPTKGRFDP